MRTGAFRIFDIDETIITSDRRKAEQAAKNLVPDGEEFTQNCFELNYRITAGLFWALFCGLNCFALSQIYPKMTQVFSRDQIRKR
jgi:hypothetical protein